MITISRRTALQLRAMFRRAFRCRGPFPAVCFNASQGTLSVKARSYDIAAEYRGSYEGEPDTLCLPFTFLDDCQGKKDDPVQVEKTGKSTATAQWRDGSVPQIVQYDLAKPVDPLPEARETFVENPPGILHALHEAGQTTDSNSTRYAVDCIQLRKDGTIAATDGRHVLVQSGFQFPWDTDVLVTCCRAFACPELSGVETVGVARAGDWVALRAGPWTFYLLINATGRYPKLDEVIPQPANATTVCRFSPAEAEFLIETLPKLPGDEAYNNPVTLDFNGRIAILARGPDQQRPTEVVLPASTLSGAPMRLGTNRTYLLRALKLGFRELRLYSDKSPLLCLDDTRRYLWMPLEPESAIKPAEDAIRIEPPAPQDVPSTSTSTTTIKTRRRIPAMQQTQSTTANGHAANGDQAAVPAANGRARKAKKADRQDVEGLIEHAVLVRTSLRETLTKTNDLLKALKRHRRQSRAIASTLASLKQLKTLGV